MKLAALSPKWIAVGAGDVGISFACPCGRCGERVYVLFANPLDGGPTVEPKGWQRTGETFDDLTLRPSIAVADGCRWHGFVTAGDVTTC
jgi:hypothetical protein